MYDTYSDSDTRVFSFLAKTGSDDQTLIIHNFWTQNLIVNQSLFYVVDVRLATGQN